MKKQIILAALGVFLLQGFSMEMPAFADRDDAYRNFREANKDARKAAHDRAEARRSARHGHSLKAKLKRMSARHHEKEAIENRKDAVEELYDD